MLIHVYGKNCHSIVRLTLALNYENQTSCDEIFYHLYSHTKPNMVSKESTKTSNFLSGVKNVYAE